MLTRVGERLAPHVERSPWTAAIGIARSALAASTLVTLFVHDPQTIFASRAVREAAVCHDLQRLSPLCIAPSVGLARWISILVLVAVAVGYRPRITAIPHWLVASGFFMGARVSDGGDQLAANLALLLLPICLTDRRRWHWSSLVEAPSSRPVASTVAWSAWHAVRLQMAALYLHAAIGKMGVAEWADGSALYYWFAHPDFGLPSWTRDSVLGILRHNGVVAALTWSSIALELLLALGLLLPRWTWKPLLIGGMSFHAFIGLLLGLPSFSVVMFAGLWLYLRDPAEPLRLPARLHRSRAEVALPVLAAGA
ncbi:MAG: sporulation-delaying protein SdpB family protein [Microthrixaceae bacterium]